jgi:2-polyprenyl-3-methyl-5-hydroxy-6-metoxy-1,4-benzoquinol methylase
LHEHPPSTPIGNTETRAKVKRAKSVRLQERAFAMGNIIGVNAYRIHQESLRQGLLAGGYRLRETAHFLVATLDQTNGPVTLIIHRFSAQEIDNDLGQYFIDELKPLGLVSNAQRYGDVFAAVVNSLCPHDPQRAWHLFGANTLRRLHRLLDEKQENHKPDYNSPIDVFAALYRRVCELVVGNSLLDVGCSFGFLPLVVAERIPALTNVVGVDLSDDPFPVTRTIARERSLEYVTFTQGDLLAKDCSAIGRFDTVTALHVLEHFSEPDMYRVLAHLLQVTSRRLILAVPFEPGPMEQAYDHKQLFTSYKLQAVGRWCVERMGGGKMTYEECAGGMVVVDVGG